MKIIINELPTFHALPSTDQRCFFCYLDTVQWISIRLGVLLCSNCVAKCRSLNTPTASIKLDSNRLDDILKRKVLINLGYDYIYDGIKPVGLCIKTKERLDSLSEIKDFINKNNEFIAKIDEISKMNINVFQKEEVKPAPIMKPNGPIKVKKWQVIDSEELEKMNSELHAGEKVSKLKKKSESTTTLEKKKNEISKESNITKSKKEKPEKIAETIFDDDSSEILLDHSTHLKQVANTTVTRLSNNKSVECEVSTYEFISEETKKVANKAKDSVSKVIKKFR
ncbi:hypothetical protein CDIK_2046 [Cucumispora dikerogammari]|nr:hypothetical protein CDIK_2046 [Cucumispora dikerogammari]